MNKICCSTSLPSIGDYTVKFHNESALLLNFFGNKEVTRLQRIAHLGIASFAFTGLNHTRWEYTLLRCAIIDILSMLYKNNDHIALSSVVSLDGLPTIVSSGSELLKCWALLSAYGHCNYTIGVERTIFLAAIENRDVRKWVDRNNIRHTDLCDWQSNLYNSEDYTNFHMLLSLKKIAIEKPYCRDKTLFRQMIRNLVLPYNKLFPNDPVKRFKLHRLQSLNAFVRLLASVTLDSHNSHVPCKIELMSVINDITRLEFSEAHIRRFSRRLEEVYAWLADELYLSPRAVTIQREYEKSKRECVISMCQKARNSQKASKHIMQNIMYNGFGFPKLELQHLIRLSEDSSCMIIPVKKTVLKEMKLFEEMINVDNVYVSIVNNPHSRNVYIDIITKKDISLNDVKSIMLWMNKFIYRSIIRYVVHYIKRIYKAASKLQIPRIKDLMNERMEYERKKITSKCIHMYEAMFNVCIRNLLPSQYRMVTNCLGTVGDSSQQVMLRLLESGEVFYDDAQYWLGKHINENVQGYTRDKIHEIKFILKEVMRSKAKTLICCAEEVKIVDENGNKKHEWDGVILEIEEDNIVLTILEAKNYHNTVNAENEAWRQLEATIKTIRGNRKVRYRRERVSGYGAKVKINFGA